MVVRSGMNGDGGQFRAPPAFLEVAAALEGRGYEAWAVGGALRDELLGVSSRPDWDLATDARPDDVRRVFQRTVPIGVEHGTVGVIGSDGVMYEVTTFRLDVETDGRHAVVSFAEEIDDDLARRDFTINALAWRPETDELRDPFGGRADLESRILRSVGTPADRFAEDYLRVLRGLRFAGGLRLDFDPPTMAALTEAAAWLDRLSAERVRDELIKVLAAAHASEALDLYARTGALAEWYPELDAVARNDPRWELDLAAVEAIPASRPLIRLARLLVPIASDGEIRHERAGEIMNRLRFSNADANRVRHLLRHYEPLVSPTDSSAQLRAWLVEVGAAHARDLFRLHFAAARAGAAEERTRYLLAVWRRVHDELLERPPLLVSDLTISGDDLLDLGVPQGPAIGVLLDELHARVIEDPDLNRADTLRELALELARVGFLTDDAGTEPPPRGRFDPDDSAGSDDGETAGG